MIDALGNNGFKLIIMKKVVRNFLTVEIHERKMLKKNLKTSDHI